MAGDFVDVSNLGNVDKLIDESLTVHLGQYSALVVVPAKNRITAHANVTRHA
jgi:hypothetical protein